VEQNNDRPATNISKANFVIPDPEHLDRVKGVIHGLPFILNEHFEVSPSALYKMLVWI
jgi:hypothetical protein